MHVKQEHCTQVHTLSNYFLLQRKVQTTFSSLSLSTLVLVQSLQIIYQIIKKIFNSLDPEESSLTVFSKLNILDLSNPFTYTIIVQQNSNFFDWNLSFSIVCLFQQISHIHLISLHVYHKVHHHIHFPHNCSRHPSFPLGQDVLVSHSHQKWTSIFFSPLNMFIVMTLKLFFCH